MTATMKAVVLTGYGEPHDVLRLDTIAKPTPTHGEVLVRVRVAAVNDWDWCYARGKPQIYRLIFGLTRPNVAVLGVDVSGVVETVGEGVGTLAVGDEVYGDLSEAGFGGFAEYVCCRQDAWTKKPSRMTFEQAAALPHASMLALQGLVDIGKIQNGERVLINGAGGGVDHASQVRASQTKQVHVLALKPNQGLTTINEMFETTGLQCLIDGTYTLADVPRALQRFGAAEHTGKILISISG